MSGSKRSKRKANRPKKIGVNPALADSPRAGYAVRQPAPQPFLRDKTEVLPAPSFTESVNAILEIMGKFRAAIDRFVEPIAQAMKASQELSDALASVEPDPAEGARTAYAAAWSETTPYSPEELDQLLVVVRAKVDIARTYRIPLMSIFETNRIL